jgi:cytochrome c-type biogenesis protein CcsB
MKSWISQNKKLKHLALAAALFMGLGLNEARTEEAQFIPGQKRSGWSFQEFAKIPVLSGGRIKPFDTYAREIILYQTGSRYFRGWSPTEYMLSVMSFPEAWEAQEFISVAREDVKLQLGLNKKESRFSPKQLTHESHLPQYLESIFGQDQGKSVGLPQVVGGADGLRQDPREKELKQLVERLALHRKIISGDAWILIPAEKNQPWWPLTADPVADPERTAEIKRAFARTVLAYRDGRQSDFENFSRDLRGLIEAAKGEVPGFAAERDAELLYNQSHPFLWSWIFYLVSGVLWTVVVVTQGASIASKTPWLKRLALSFTWIALAFNTFGFAIRGYVAGRPPVTNMYESIIWVMFGVVCFSLYLYWRTGQGVVLAVAGFVATAGMVLADAAPAMMDPGIHPLVPVLRSNYWLTIHVLTITLGYSAFAISLGVSNVTLFHFLRGEHREGIAAKIAQLNQITYRAMQIGVVLLGAGTILGGIWADYSWGRFWGWDPKEVWALIAFLFYIAILHSRFVGWIKPFGFALWSVIAFNGVLMAWYGVNFVLGVGLHSYGFATGGRGVVASIVGVQLLYCLAVALKRHSSKAKVP